MLTRSKLIWKLPESAATDEADFINRGELCKTVAAGSILAGSASLIDASSAFAATEKITTTYNNSSEFGSHKNIWKAAQKVRGKEYGFWANVSPEVDHPRWSQATENLLDTGKRVPTLLYNGYAEQVAGLYTEVQKKE